MLFDLLFPKTCLSCGKWGVYICLDCQRKLVYIQKEACFYCKKSSFLGLTHQLCRRKNGIDGVLSLIYYNPTAKKIIKGIKYRLVKNAFNEILLINSWDKVEKYYTFKKIFNNCLVQPIPLHQKKLLQRGFNQSQLFAQYYSHLLGYPTADVLWRVKETLPQAQISSGLDRYKNIQNAFSVKNNSKVFGQDIILVDDVITSGHTTKEATNELKKHGARNVFVFTFAQG